MEPKGQKSSQKRIVARYCYQDEKGRVLYERVRREPKRFLLRRPDGNGDYVYSLREGWWVKRHGKYVQVGEDPGSKPYTGAVWFNEPPRVLYRLPEIRSADKAVPILYLNGEKDVERAIKLGLNATTAGHSRDWQDDFSEEFANRPLVILPKNNKECQELAHRIASASQGKATSVKVINLQVSDPPILDGKDFSDWCDAGGTVENLNESIQNAKEWDPKDIEPKSLLWKSEDFLARYIATKEPLVEGLLYSREIVAAAGRRRHGKTTLLTNLAAALALGLPDFLRYKILRPLNVLFCYLEDDPGEIQEKLRRILDGRSAQGRLALITREDFHRSDIPIDLKNETFQQTLKREIQDHKAAVVFLDNLAHLVGGDYNNSKLIHDLNRFVWQITWENNASVVIAAHPRKRSRDPRNPHGVRLRNSSEDFFEEVMGSSHFVNSCGSLWGIERDHLTGNTDFLGGAQRFTGQESIASLTKDDKDWFHVQTDDREQSIVAATNTVKRQSAWDSLSTTKAFSYLEAEALVCERQAIMSKSTFYHWWHNSLIRQKLVLPVAGSDPEHPRYTRIEEDIPVDESK